MFEVGILGHVRVRTLLLRPLRRISLTVGDICSVSTLTVYFPDMGDTHPLRCALCKIHKDERFMDNNNERDVLHGSHQVTRLKVEGDGTEGLLDEGDHCAPRSWSRDTTSGSEVEANILSHDRSSGTCIHVQNEQRSGSLTEMSHGHM